MRCRPAFDGASVHANGDVVCSILDGRGDFVLGNVHERSLADIFSGPRAGELRRLVLSATDSWCPAIGKRCPLKVVPAATDGEVPAAKLRCLAIEPTTACTLRCLACPVRDFSGLTWRDALRDGGAAFCAWDTLRRAKQHVADGVSRFACRLDPTTWARWRRRFPLLLRGRIPGTRTGTLPIDVLKRVVTEAGPDVERIDLFNYGEPFLYTPLVEALRHIRRVSPRTVVAVATNGMLLPPSVETALVAERLVDYLVFSLDGYDEESYARYRIGGRFAVGFSNLVRFHQRAAGTSINVIWQYVVFRWNDRDEQLGRAIDAARAIGVPIWFDFTRTWGRSRRHASELRYLVPHLRPLTSLPGEPRPAW